MKVFIPLSLVSFLSSATLHAEVTLDGTLGSRLALDGPDYAIGAEFGQQHGSNLFHSFGKFNLNSNESATFSGPDSISNVISRVTGGTPSSLDGAIRSTIPEANVYLINPAGLMFGPNATLDVQGSFHASTADTLRFSDGSEFNASTPSKSLLTVAPVSAFGFLTPNPQPLTIEGSELTSSPGKTLSLVGGTLQITEAFLEATAGRINLAGVANQGDVRLLPQDLALSAQAGDVSLQDSEVTTSGEGSGNIYIRGGQFLVDNTIIVADTLGATDGGGISVQADSLIATRGGQFISDTYGAGRGGNIKIKVTGLTEFSGEIVDEDAQVQNSGIKVISREGGGDGGNLELETGTFNLKEGAFITAATEGQGQGGNLNIRATEAITLSGLSSDGYSSAINANAYGEMENAGHGGTMTLEARQLYLTDGALIGANTYGSGQGGNISLKIADSVTLSGENDEQTSGIETSTLSSGEGGSIVLETNQLILKEGTRLVANTEGTGRGGNLKIQVSDLVKLEGLDSYGVGAYVQANSQGEMAEAGDAGTIELTAGRVYLADGGQIGTTTFGPGQGGKLYVEVAKEATFSGQDDEGYSSGLFTSSQSTADNPGHGGTLVLKVGDLQLTDKAEIYAETWGDGNGGSIDIQAQTLKLASSGRITARSDGEGEAGQVTLTIGNRLLMRNGVIETSAESADGGNITLTAPSYVYLIDSQISSSVSEEFGGGGNLTLNPNFIVLDGSQIFAKAKKGAGGNINITTTGVYNFTGEPIGQIINASSEFGVDGEVTISTPDGNAVEGIFALPATFMDASGLIDTPCDQRVAENLSSLILVQSEGSTNAAGDLFASGPLLVQIDKPVASSQKPQRTQTHRPLKLALLTGCKPHSKAANKARGYEPDTNKSQMTPEQLF
jgi:filamentous hemagglutinin family protein